MDKRYERLLDAAQDAIERRNRARREIEHVLSNDNDEATLEEPPTEDTPSDDRPPETWRRLPI